MNTYLKPSRRRLQLITHAVRRFLLGFKSILLEQFNKNLYTRILFTNVTVFVIGIIALTIFSSYIVKQVIYDHAQQELLRKAKRVNYVLLQQEEPAGGDSKVTQTGGWNQGRQEALKLLADSFDVKITVFNKEGNITEASAEQEVVPGSIVETKYTEKITKGETMVYRTVERETGQLIFIAVVPMGNNKDAIENGIMLETKPADLNLALNKMRFNLLIGGIVMLVIVIIISVYLAMYISRPISRLSTAVAEISRGSYVLNTDIQPLDEINDLAGQLNKLTVRLQNIQAENSRMEDERARLFAEISHELRTPLTAVQGFVEAIRDGVVQDEALLDKYLNTIYTQTMHITRLVDDILALSRLESGNITVEKLPVDLIALAQGVVISLEGLANSKNTSIVFEKKTENAIVVGDVDRMEQIIRNLLKNAIKATEKGEIKVSITAKQREVVLTIEDNGIGIPPDDLPHIWDRFYRAKNQRENNTQEIGSGLGLVIVKKLVQLQNGRINVTSHLGEGTTFNISFPSFNNKNK